MSFFRSLLNFPEFVSGRNIVAFFAMSVLLNGCANIVAPTGGPKDSLPPKIDTTLSSPNFVTNFKKQNITIRFNEFVVVNEAFKEVLVSPPLEFPVKVNANGKNVVFEFDKKEILKENTTYSINFGNSIRDFTENNQATNINYVFSTGNVLDSLSFKGKINDPATEKKNGRSIAMLYKDIEDSVVYKSKPYYASFADDKGNFKFGNLSAGIYKMVALYDLNSNYIYDINDERIGFLDSLLHVSDSTPVDITLKLFNRDPGLQLKEIDSSYQRGYTFITLSRSVDDITVTFPKDSVKYLWLKDNDKLFVWHYADTSISWALRLNVFPERTDTFRVQSNKKEYVGGPLAVKVYESKPAIAVEGEPATFSFNYPVIRTDISKLKIQRGGVEIKPKSIEIDSTFPTVIKIDGDFQKDSVYNFIFMKGALTDYFGRPNDSMGLSPKFKDIAQFGTLKTTITGLDSTLQYVVFLKVKDKVIYRKVVANQPTWLFGLSLLNPESYTVDIVEDVNKNGRWDTGDYLKHTQPEYIFTQALEALKPNWEMETTVKYSK